MPEPTPRASERKERLRPESFAESYRGEKKTGENEDAFFADDEHGFYGVFDGMGGHEKGELASQMTRDVLRQKGEEDLDIERWKTQLGEQEIVGMLPEKLASMIRQAHQEVGRESLAMAQAWWDAKSSEERKEWKEMQDDLRRKHKFRGPGTTASVVKVFEREDGSRVAAVATVGDGPVYVWRGDEKRLELVGGGTDDILDPMSVPDDQKEAARTKVRNAQSKADVADDYLAGTLWNYRNVISQSVGQIDQTGEEEDGKPMWVVADIAPKTNLVELGPNDDICIFSDGVTDNMTEEGEGGLAHVIGGPGTPRQKGKVLLNGALLESRKSKDENERAKPDDMTVVIVPGGGAS